MTFSYTYHPDVFSVGFVVAFYDKGFDCGITIFFWSLKIEIKAGGRRNENSNSDTSRHT